MKLLGVPAFPYLSNERAGTLIAEATVDLIQDWECEEYKSGMVFDTTWVNTGQKTAGCVSVQEKLGKPLLWFACRPDVIEVVLKHTWDALKIEVAKKPEISIFEWF